MTLVLRDGEVRSLVSYPAAVEIVARGVVAAAAADPPAAAERSTARFDGGWLRIMSGTLPHDDVLGFKAFHLVPGAGVRYLGALYRLSDGEPLALIDSNYVTVVRTSAAAAAAAARFWESRPFRLAVIGTGTLARDGLRALASVCAVEAVSVYSRNGERRDRYVADLGHELDLDLRAARSPAEATAAADMVLCATQTMGEVALSAEDAGAPRYISSVSSTLPVQRELDGHLIASAGLVVVDTPDALHESGDLLAAAAAGLDESRVVTLATYLGEASRSTAQPVIYKSIGSVEQDLALATALFREAERRDVGDRIPAVEAAQA
jgi:ornithine cyclodeaminase/alanine dehydrogenase-like protein (mu-crystallin family)